MSKERPRVQSHGLVSYSIPRENGPSWIHPSGVIHWEVDGLKHREEGPKAYFPKEGKTQFYLHGEFLSHEEFLRRTLGKQV